MNLYSVPAVLAATLMLFVLSMVTLQAQPQAPSPSTWQSPTLSGLADPAQAPSPSTRQMEPSAGKTVSAQAPSPSTPITLSIDSGWEFAELGTNEWRPAVVPGTIHQDLLRHGIIDDPHYRMNEDDVQWVETRDWEYRTVFQVDGQVLSSDEVELTFGGLDTYADVYLNEVLILEANNMFVGWTVPVKEHLREGENRLRVHLHSPVRRGRELADRVPYVIPNDNEQVPQEERTGVFTRKAPFHYGWDWGPRLVTSGVWRPVELTAWNHAALTDLYVFTRYAQADLATLGGRAEVEVLTPGTYTLSLVINGQTEAMTQRVRMAAGTNVVPFEFDMENPQLWWTNGLGEPYLYDFHFELSREGTRVDEHRLDFGVRTLRLVQRPDEVGRTFFFELNGVPVFMKGANVIPSETLTPAVEPERYERLFRNATAAHMNMLRVWGGAIYEEDLFYELADRNGILIWQDFMFACNLQPGDEPHLENILLEAEYNVRRLRNFASVALWCGNNENLHGWHHWGWKRGYEPEVREFMWRTYERIFYEILPDVVGRLDPDRAYWSSSPSAYGNQIADRRSGDEHDWTIWFGERPFSDYAVNTPRFISEYGMQAFPGMHTIREFAAEEDFDVDSQVMRHRQRGIMNYIEPGFIGNDMIRRYMGRYYQVPEAFEEFVYVSQIMHAKAYKTAIEAHRRNMPITMGSLYWQLNDSWPAISWSTVDYFGRWKAAHYAVRKAYREVIVSAAEDEQHMRIYAVSDRLQPVEQARLVVNVIDFDGAVRYETEQTITVPANTSTVVLEESLQNLLDRSGASRTGSAVHIQLREGSRLLHDNIHYFERPVALQLPEADVSVVARRIPEGYALTVRADVLVKNLFLDTPWGDVFFTDNFFDMVPGQAYELVLQTDREVDMQRELIISSLNALQNR